jgi:hypothetical protein
VRARLSPRAALAAAARDAERVALKVAARAARIAPVATGKRALSYRGRNLEKCRAAERANYAANPERHHAKARRYRDSHPEVEAARHARFYAAKKARADAERARKEQRREYDAKRRARLAAESCQASP